MLKVIALSLVFNSLLIVGAVAAAGSGLTPLVVPILAGITVIEIVLLRASFAGRPRGGGEPSRREEAVRRIDFRRKSSIIDDTTGLYTRWYFDRRIDEEAARCKRYKHSMAVVVLRIGVVDLTTFSTDGWQKQSLAAAQKAAKVIREVDISASLTPFEFAICLIHCDRDGAYKALERMMVQLPDHNCEAGVAVYPEEGYEPSAMVEVASARLRPLRLQANAS
ncbi:MAG: GGDEF domain-containing protein [Dehalococcoidia bacterium]